MSVPTLRELKNDSFLQDSWRICRTCQGGRGQIVEIETLEGGEPVKRFKVIVCRTCSGTRVVPKI